MGFIGAGFRIIKGRRKGKRDKDLDEKLMILNTMSELIAFLNVEHRVLFANKALVEFSGLDQEQINGEYCYKVWYRSNNPCENCPVDRAIKSGKREMSIIEAEDGSKWEITAYPMWEGKRLVGIVEVGRNVTDKLGILDRLEKEKERYKFIVDNVSDVIFQQGVDFKVNYISRSVEKYLGYTPEEIYEKDVRDLMTSESYQRGVENLGKLIEAVKKNENYDMPLSEYEYISKDGRKVWGEMKVKYLTDSMGNITGIHGVIRDITRRKQIEELLKFEREQLLNIFNGIKEPVYVSDPVTHEILFVNRAINDLIGRNPVGEKCYKAFQGFDRPCDFCTNPIIMKNPGETYQWEHYNDLFNRHYLIFDRIIKWPDGRDVRFEMAIDITKRKKVEDALRDSENKYRTLFENAGDGIVVTDRNGRIIDINRKFCSYSGYRKEQLIGKNIVDLICRDSSNSLYDTTYDEELIRSDGSRVAVETTTTEIKYKDSESILTVVRDISKRKNLERQLSLSQKMEAIGRLTGGIAHDFNNLLTVILGNVDLILYQKDLTDRVKEFAEEIKQASKRASDLIGQLLAYSRKQILKPTVVNLNDLVLNLERMIKRIIGENIIFKLYLDDTLNDIKVDPSQMEQVIVNILVNAKDAMPSGGEIKLSTRNISLKKETYVSSYLLKPGNYVVLSISDTGHGMDEEVRKRIFDPFFTTKITGKGTGLGLSTVYGFIKQSGGYIFVDSKIGRGTTFTIYLPAYYGVVEKPNSSPSFWKDDDLSGESERILIVEDEPVVRDMVYSILKEWGYSPFAVEDGSAALKVLNFEKFDLVITDVIMPGMGGVELADAVSRIGLDVKILFMSGYSNNEALNRRIDSEYRSFIKKPFTPEELLKKVKSIVKR